MCDDCDFRAGVQLVLSSDPLAGQALDHDLDGLLNEHFAGRVVREFYRFGSTRE